MNFTDRIVQTLEVEKAADEKLTKIAESVANLEAEEEEDPGREGNQNDPALEVHLSL
jgi:hypothetical protein